MSGYLELPDGGFLGVKNGLVFGRVSGCDVVVQDTKASRRHARLIVEAGVVEIEDMGSSNGTLLNGKPIERRMMRDGDEVRIGKTVIKYREGPLPGSHSKSRSSGGGASIFDDDDDLFGGDAAPAKAPEPVRPPPPPPSPVTGNVVEFEDEVVEVEQAPPPLSARREPEPEVEVRQPRQDVAAGKAKPASGGAAAVSGTSGRILQYSKKAGGKNPLGDDLGQMSGGMRLLVVIAVIAVGGGIVYGIMTAMQ